MIKVIKEPIISEKMTKLSEKLNQYGFIVQKEANKIEIKKAVEELYNVTVDSVNTMNYKGKLRSRFTKSGLVSGRTQNFKKAVVTLAEGDTIDFFSNI